MSAWFKSDKDENDTPANDGDQKVIVTDIAREKISQLIQNAETPVLGVRILAEATSPVNPQYSLAFVQEGEVFDDDTIIDVGDFTVYIDGDSLQHVDGVELDFVTTQMGGGGFRIEKPKLMPNLTGDLAEKLQKVITDQINPALAMHGGNITLIDIKENRAYIELGGGCRGCGMVDVTLKNGIETLIKQNVPEITEVLDTTDHASGDNPYYQPSK